MKSKAFVQLELELFPAATEPVKDMQATRAATPMPLLLAAKASCHKLSGDVAWASRGTTRREAIEKLLGMLSTEFRLRLAAVLDRLPENDRAARKFLDAEGLPGILLRTGYGNGFFAGAKTPMLISRLTSSSPLVFPARWISGQDDFAPEFDTERAFDECWYAGKCPRGKSDY